jgi:hypothetical protein
LVVVAVPLSYLMLPLLELQQVVQVVQVINLQVELELPQLLLIHQVQVVAVVVSSPLAVTQQVTQAVLAEMAEAEAEALTTQEHQVLVATA